jgi:signal transduction histidine kinase/ActR/RegA family two-component response regulator
MRAVHRFVWLVVLALGVASRNEAASEAKQVLVVQSFDQAQLTYGRLTDSLKAELSRRFPQPFNFVQFSLAPAGFKAAPEEGVAEYLRSLFTHRPSPDLIMTIGAPAAEFIHKYRERLFPGTPALLAGVDERFLRNTTLPAAVAVVAVKNDPAQMIENILRVLPDTTHVFVVLGTSVLEQSWREVIRRDALRYPRLTFDWASGSFQDILKHAATLPDHSAILYGMFTQDGQGAAYDEEHILAELHAVGTAPLFGFQSYELGHGIVGGPLIPLDDLSNQTVDVAVRILNGESPGQIKTSVQAAGVSTFDWNELRHWDIDESRLPAGSRVLLREPTLWERGKWVWVTGGAIGLFEGLLIVGLVVNLDKRKRTERSLREREAQLRQMASELTLAEQHARGQLAKTLHDGLQQLLVVAAMNLEQQAQRDSQMGTPTEPLVQAKRHLDEAIDAARSLSFELSPPLSNNSGLTTALSWLASWAHDKYGLDVRVSADPLADFARPDIRTMLFEAVRELLFNAVKHARVEHVDVDLSRGANDTLCITVSDRGVGFDPSELATRTRTAQGGWGLFSIRERLALLGGRFEIDSTPGQGTRFRLIAPRDIVEGSIEVEPTSSLSSMVSTSRTDDEERSRALRILIVDDHAELRTVLRRLLEQYSELHVVGEAANGVEAIERAHALDPDVVLMDVSMPILDGIEATRRLHAELPHLEILGLSMYSRTEDPHPIERAGATGFFTKRGDIHRLIERLVEIHADAHRQAGRVTRTN